MSDHGHDFMYPVTGLSRPCQKCGYRLTLVAEVIAAIPGSPPIPSCPAKNPTHQGFNPQTQKLYDIYDGTCACDMKNLLSSGHDPGCPEQKVKKA